MPYLSLGASSKTPTAVKTDQASEIKACQNPTHEPSAMKQVKDVPSAPSLHPTCLGGERRRLKPAPSLPSSPPDGCHRGKINVRGEVANNHVGRISAV